MIKLQKMADWIIEEYDRGEIRKANRILKVFEKYAKNKYPKLDMSKLNLWKIKRSNW